MYSACRTRSRATLERAWSAYSQAHPISSAAAVSFAAVVGTGAGASFATAPNSRRKPGPVAPNSVAGQKERSSCSVLARSKTR